MLPVQQLWNSYHAAVKAGKMDLAKRILRSIQSTKKNPRQSGGCAKCKRRFT